MARLEEQAAECIQREEDGVARLEMGMPKYESYGWLS
jgi:hypothetical protein